MKMMKNVLMGLSLAIVGTSLGCYSQPRLTQSENQGSVTDITPPSMASTTSTPSASLYQPAPAPVVTQQPTISDSAIAAAPAITSTPTSSNNGSWTVKKGDTMYGIAKRHYGDGKQWTKIASANPGVTPQSLKVGQTLVLP